MSATGTCAIQRVSRINYPRNQREPALQIRPVHSNSKTKMIRATSPSARFRPSLRFLDERSTAGPPLELTCGLVRNRTGSILKDHPYETNSYFHPHYPPGGSHVRCALQHGHTLQHWPPLRPQGCQPNRHTDRGKMISAVHRPNGWIQPYNL
jgi:hypothetical protein